MVGATDATTGQAIVAFVILRGNGDSGVGDDRPAAGAARPRRQGDRPDRQAAPIMVVPELPKTRSGKIMRRLLRDVAENRELGDVTTLADSAVMDLIQTGLAAKGAAAED